MCSSDFFSATLSVIYNIFSYQSQISFEYFPCSFFTLVICSVVPSVLNALFLKSMTSPFSQGLLDMEVSSISLCITTLWQYLLGDKHLHTQMLKCSFFSITFCMIYMQASSFLSHSPSSPLPPLPLLPPFSSLSIPPTLSPLGMGVVPVCVPVYTCVPCIHRDQKRALDSLELDSQYTTGVIEGCEHLGAENRTLIFWKSSQCS